MTELYTIIRHVDKVGSVNSGPAFGGVRSVVASGAMRKGRVHYVKDSL